jgi:short-subunit dehydrogenase
MDQYVSRRTAIITGASRGIGLELARLLAGDGHDLVLVSRTAEELERARRQLVEQYGVSVRCYSKDLSKPGEALDLWREVEKAGVAVDILVNNAGSGVYGPLAQQDPSALSAMVGLNVVALTMLTRLALPGMIERRRGRILNVASIVGYQPGGPRMAAYYASKSYVLSFSKGVSRELDGTGVTVTALCPPTTRTAFEERSGAKRSVLYSRLPVASPEAVARAGYRGMKRGARVVLPGLSTKLLAIAGELPPRRIALEVNRLLLREA